MKWVEVELTVEMQKGKGMHSILEENCEKRAKLRLSVHDVLKKSQKERIHFIGREVLVIGNGLYGLIYEVRFTPDQILIIYDKLSNFAFITHKKQVWSYCFALQEHFSDEHGNIVNRRF